MCTLLHWRIHTSILTVCFRFYRVVDRCHSWINAPEFPIQFYVYTKLYRKYMLLYMCVWVRMKEKLQHLYCIIYTLSVCRTHHMHIIAAISDRGCAYALRLHEPYFCNRFSHLLLLLLLLFIICCGMHLTVTTSVLNISSMPCRISIETCVVARGRLPQHQFWRCWLLFIKFRKCHLILRWHIIQNIDWRLASLHLSHYSPCFVLVVRSGWKMTRMQRPVWTYDHSMTIKTKSDML